MQEGFLGHLALSFSDMEQSLSFKRHLLVSGSSFKYIVFKRLPINKGIAGIDYFQAAEALWAVTLTFCCDRAVCHTPVVPTEARLVPAGAGYHCHVQGTWRGCGAGFIEQVFSGHVGLLKSRPPLGWPFCNSFQEMAVSQKEIQKGPCSRAFSCWKAWSHGWLHGHGKSQYPCK